MVAESTFREAESALLARRRSQRGSHTLGDDADRALLAALLALPAGAAPAARDAGRRLGEDVYSRRFHEDTLPGAIGTLSSALDRSGVGSLRLASSFHRTALVAYDPAPALARAAPDVTTAFVEGVVEGFLAVGFNCQAHARPEGTHALRVQLGEGRDVNAQRRQRA